MATPLFHHPLPPALLLHIETSLETLNKLLGEGGIGAAFVFLFRFPSTGGRIEENRGEEMAFFVSFCNYSNYDPTKGSRCYGDSRKKYRGRDRIVRLEILLGTASVGSKGRKLGEGRKEKKKEKMVGDLLTKYGRQASQRGADKGDR